MDEVVVVRAGSVDEVRAALAVLGLAPPRAAADRPALDVVAPDDALSAARKERRAGDGSSADREASDDGGPWARSSPS
ncbi:MAG: hypothetical protein U1E39_18720 [Planctomycetota bacterium]